jgi:hypothetical protein
VRFEKSIKHKKGGLAMPEKSAVFEKNRDFYLQQLEKLDLKKAADKAGCAFSDGELFAPFLDGTYSISPSGVFDESGKPASYQICIVLFKYVLTCFSSSVPFSSSEWTAYRQFKDAGPLVVYFANDVEKALERHFDGKVPRLKRACERLGGKVSGLEVSHDAAFEFQALPRAPLLLLFTDRDDEFEPSCSVLFQKSLENFLDMESVAILARIFAEKLVKKDKGA